MANERKPEVKRLPSQHWIVRWSRHRWIQWPVGRAPTIDDGFGWIGAREVRIATELTMPEPTDDR